MADAADPSSKANAQPTQLGSYRLVHPLGAGGMSSVFLAEHVESGHEVALKVLPRSLARKTTLLQRFLREAKSAEALQHPNIVAIYDRGMDDGRYYIVLEYLAGGDLHERVRKHGPLPIDQAVQIIKDVARGLQYAQAQGLIHRDIKPANLLLTADGKVKVTDLGLALQQDDEDERVTRSGTTVGTVDYMAPEQARDSRATSVRSDIYSLGCTFYFLLAGEPPFVGGSVPEKLRRHAIDPAPDVRTRRPEVPEPLAALIRRMMAKKPTQRFVDYAHLLQALDELTIEPGGAPSPPALDRPATIEDLLTTPGSGTPDLLALLDDEPPARRPGSTSGSNAGSGTPRRPGSGSGSTSGEEGFRVGPVRPAGEPGTGPAPGSTRSSPTVSTPEAAPTVSYPAMPSRLGARTSALESAPHAELAGGSPVRPPVGSPRRGENLRGREPGPYQPQPGAIPIDVVEEIVAPVPQIGVIRPQPVLPSTPPTLVALRLALGLLVLAFAGIGLKSLLDRGGRIGDGDAGAGPRAVGENAGADQAGGPQGDGVVRGAVPPVQLLGPGVPAAAVAATVQPGGWNEPADPAIESPAPLTIPNDRLTEFDLESAAPDGPDRPLPPVVRVRRVDASRGGNRVESLRAVLDKPSGTAEIADDGPFFEDDWHIDGAQRIVRAADGYRPRIVALPTRKGVVRARPALIVLDARNRQKLTLEGLDLVVQAADLPKNQWALFLCGDGTELTLRDCTITVEGPIDRPLAVVQVGEPGKGGANPARIRFERTLVRGPGLSAVRIEDGPAEVTATGSVFLCGPAPAFRAAGAPAAERTLRLLASVVATAGPVVELAGSAARPEARPTTVRSLGSCFAHVASEAASPGLIVSRGRPGGGPSGAGVDWRGDRNTFSGWPGPVDPTPASADRVVTVANLAHLQAQCAGTDPGSQALDAAWPAATQTGWAEPRELAATLGDQAPALRSVARPRPWLRDWTVGQLAPLAIAVPGTGTGGQPTQNLEFDASASPWDGDLGRYLAETVAAGATRVRVVARGAGWRPFTPIRLRPGLSLELIVMPPGPGDDPLSWRPVDGASAGALIAVSDAELRLEGARFERGADRALATILTVDQGLLSLTRCVLQAPWSVETGGGGLIAFRNPGSRPLSPAGEAPVCALTDTVLLTGGEALRAELGRGLVALTNSAVAGGAAALVLEPAASARDRFAVDLRLDRCTIAGSQELVRLGPWPGAGTGPDRPWLLQSQGCAFVDATARIAGAPRTTSTAVLLRADSDALARGTLLWQSAADSYDVPHYSVGGSATPLPTSFRSAEANWTRIWGPSHVLDPRSEDRALRLAPTRTDADRLTLADLQLVAPGARPGQPLDVGADLSWLALPVPKPATGRPARNR